MKQANICGLPEGERTDREEKSFASFLQKRSACLLLLSLIAAAPRLVPTQDVQIDYTVTPRDHAPIDVHVAIEAGGRHLRIAGEDLPTAFLVDRPAETATILLPMLKLYSTVSIGKFDPEQTILPGARFERHGQRTMAGLACTDWTARSPRGQASACITEDGVILAGTAADGSGPLGTVRASTVRYGALLPVLFRRPDGYRSAGDLSGFAGFAR